MKRIILIVMIIALWAGAAVAGEEYRIYDPKEPALPQFIIKERSDGTLDVYDVSGKDKNYVLPRYNVRNGKVYESSKPCLPTNSFSGGKGGRK